MRLRMYVTLPDLDCARRLANDLLLARVEDKHMHFLARRGTDLGELHEASHLQKTDAVHGAFTGFVTGGIMWWNRVVRRWRAGATRTRAATFAGAPVSDSLD